MPRSIQPAPGVVLPDSTTAFLAEPHLGVLTTMRPDGTPHSVPVRFTWDPQSGLARVLTVASSRKARNALTTPGSRATLCQVDGPCWVTLEGTLRVTADLRRVLEGARRYARRYAAVPPSPPDRVVLEIRVDRAMRLNI